MTKKLINPAELYDGSVFGMSQAVYDTDSNLIFISGQVDWNKEFQVTTKTIEEQFKKALENLDTILKAANSSLENLLHIKIYVRGEAEDHLSSLAPLMVEYLGNSRPSVTGIGVASLASRDTLVEVEAIAKAIQ